MRYPAIAVVLLTSLAACASSKQQAGAAPAPEAAAAPADTTPPPASMSFAVTPERIWAALPKAYKRVGLTVNAVDSATRSMGFAGVVRRQLAGTPMSKFFACGNQMGENADVYDIILFIGTQVASDPVTHRITVSTNLRVSARSPAFATTTTVCTTKGELERRLWSAINAEVQ